MTASVATYGVTRTTMFETPDGIRFRYIDSAARHCATFGYNADSIKVIVFVDDIY